MKKLIFLGLILFIVKIDAVRMSLEDTNPLRIEDKDLEICLKKFDPTIILETFKNSYKSNQAMIDFARQDKDKNNASSPEIDDFITCINKSTITNRPIDTNKSSSPDVPSNADIIVGY